MIRRNKTLVTLFKEDRIDDFIAALNAGADVNYRVERTSDSVFELACKTPKKSAFIEQCICYGAELNEPKPDDPNKFPIHLAAQSNDSDNLLALLTNKNIIVDRKSDLNTGSTALCMLFEMITQSNYDDVWNCIKLLLEYHANINTTNSEQKTPIQHVLENKSLSNDKKTFILQYCLSNYYCNVDENTKSLIQAKYPDVQIPEYTSIHELFDQLRDILNSETIETFIEICQERYHCIDNPEPEMIRRLLQITISRGKLEAAQTLLEPKLVNGKVHDCSTLLNGLLEKCCMFGDVEILQLLLDVVPEGDVTFLNRDSLLSTVVSQMGTKMENFNNRFYECMEILLEDGRIEIDKRDGVNNTALAYAGRYKNGRAQKMLLAKGAYIGGKDLYKMHMLGSINLDLLQRHLDSCVTGSDRQLNSMTLEVNVMNFVPPKFKSSYREHEYEHSNDESFHNVLVALIEFMGCDSSAKKIILHPVILCLLSLKFNQLWFVQFMGLVFSTIIFFGLYWNAFLPVSLKVILGILLFVGVVVSMMYLWIHVVSQCFRIKRVWVTRIIEVCFKLIVRISSIVFLINVFDDEIQQILAAYTILASGIVLILALRTISIFSIGPNILMFAVVLFNLLKCMIPCGVVLVAFAMSFHVINLNNNDREPNETQEPIMAKFDDTLMLTKLGVSNEAIFDKFANVTLVDLFKAVKLLSNVTNSANSADANNDQFNSFANIYLAILKAAVMMTGEFNSSEMHLTKTWFALMFTMFVFGVAIAFYNLLNGLAVSDIALLRKESTMLGIRQKIIVLYEWNNILQNLDRCLNKLRACCCFCFPNDTTFHRIIIELKPIDIVIKTISSRKPTRSTVPPNDVELQNGSRRTTNDTEKTEYKHSARYIIHEKLESALKEILHA